MSLPDPLTLNALDVQIDEEFVVWAWFRRPSFTLDLLGDIASLQTWLYTYSRSVSAVVWGSRVPGVWNRGGDLGLFERAALAQDRTALESYAHACIDAIWRSWNCPVLSLAMVQGDALGGGFEAVLTNAVVVAEPRARFGFPEVIFNSFPGMGAYSLLARRGMPAWRMIASGRTYTAAEMHEVGVVDVVDEDGQDTVQRWLHRHRRSLRGLRGLARARACCLPLTWQELVEVVEVWTDEMLDADRSDLRRIARLRREQSGT